MTTLKKKPMKGTNVELEDIPLPCLVSPKLDGIRAVVQDGVLMSNTLKPIPNKYVQGFFDWTLLEGCDGELIVGEPNIPTTYHTSHKNIMSGSAKDFEFTFHIFDVQAEGEYFERTEEMQDLVENHTLVPAVCSVPLWGHVAWVGQELCETLTQLERSEARFVGGGYEGMMVRKQEVPYKYGKSSAKGFFGIRKIKRFVDSEAVVIGMVELEHNNNEKKTNELGYSQRSSHKANKSAAGTMGALILRDVKTGVEFHCGTGFTDEQRAWWWGIGPEDREIIVKYKYFPVGVKDKPRHPVYLGLRSPDDM